jgi:hypothetical protein
VWTLARVPAGERGSAPSVGCARGHRPARGCQAVHHRARSAGRVNAATLTVAIIGAVTGLSALTAQVWQAVVSGPRVKVSATSALATNTWMWWLSIDLTNVGRLPVTVADVGVVVEVPGEEWQKMPSCDWSRGRPTRTPRRIPSGGASRVV